MNYTLIRGRPCRLMWSHRDPTIRKSGVGNVFVKHLDKNIDNKSLYDTFSAFGNILSCKVMTDEETGESLGFGYVHYQTQEAADNAIAKLNGMLLNNKQVYVGRFVPRAERSQEVQFTNLYVKGIPLDWDDAQLTEFFGEGGNVTSAVIRRTPEGESRGFGFVNFESADEAKAAIDLFNGREVTPATDDEEAKSLFVSRAQKKAEREKELKKKHEKLRQERINKYQGINLFVKNLDDSIGDDELREAFAEFGTISSAKVMKNNDGTSRGFGFVCFSTQEEASRAVAEMSSRILGSKPIYVALAERREVRRAKLEQQHAQRSANMRMQQAAAGVPGAYPPQNGGPMFYTGPQRSNYSGYPQQMGIPRPRGWQGQGPPPAMMMGRSPGHPQQGNPQQMPMAAQQPVLMPQQAPVQAQGGQDALTPSVLARASPEQQKQLLGERLYPLIAKSEPQLAGKITGMLLEMDNGELLNLLESQTALQEKVVEAVQVLREHASEAQE